MMTKGNDTHVLKYSKNKSQRAAYTTLMNKTMTLQADFDSKSLCIAPVAHRNVHSTETSRDAARMSRLTESGHWDLPGNHERQVDIDDMAQSMYKKTREYGNNLKHQNLNSNT